MRSFRVLLAALATVAMCAFAVPSRASLGTNFTDQWWNPNEAGWGASILQQYNTLFVDLFVWPSLMAGAMYEQKYPLATALGRPLIAKLMVDVAREKKAVAVAHGCTGKGNDQVRFDCTFQTLAPDLKIIAPVREWKWTRDEELKFAEKHNIPVDVKKENLFSVDQNIFGRSCEAGVLEDPWDEPPEEAFAWTADPRKTPNDPEYVEIEFAHGIPVAFAAHAVKPE